MSILTDTIRRWGAHNSLIASGSPGPLALLKSAKEQERKRRGKKASSLFVEKRRRRFDAGQRGLVTTRAERRAPQCCGGCR